MSATKRFFFYVFSLIGLGMLAGGAGTILNLLFSTITRQTGAQVGGQSFSMTTLSLGLALLVIGGVLWSFFWMAVRRATTGNIEETGSLIRKLYIILILLVSISVAIPAAMVLLQWVLSGFNLTVFQSMGPAILIVTGVIWYYHWRIEEKEGQPSSDAKTLRRWYVYILATWGLGWLSTSLVQLIYSGILHLPVWGTKVSSGAFWNVATMNFVSGILLGTAIWVFHWFKMARGDTDSTLRQVYLYLITILGGVLAGLTALTFFLDRLLRYPFGHLSGSTDGYFQFLGWTIPTALVAAAIWNYHRNIVQEEAGRAPELRFSARRVYSYLMSLISLGTLVAGLILLFGILLNLLTNSTSQPVVVAGPGVWRDLLSLSLAFLIVATPMWFYYWNRVIKMVAAGGVEERGARTRRVYLYLILGAAIAMLAADLINIVFRVLNGLLQGNFGASVLRQTQWSLQTLIVALPVLLYHWRVLRRDQILGAETVPLRKKVVTLLAPESATGIASRIEEKQGSRIRLLRYSSQSQLTAPSLSDEEFNKLISDIESATTAKVMLVVTGTGILVLPYEEK